MFRIEKCRKCILGNIRESICYSFGINYLNGLNNPSVRLSEGSVLRVRVVDSPLSSNNCKLWPQKKYIYVIIDNTKKNDNIEILGMIILINNV